MTLSAERTRAYLCGALTGAFAAVSVTALRQRRRPAAAASALLSVVCGSLAVAYEERAQR
jgi:hypothetical protein